MQSFISIENASLRFRRWRNPSPQLKEAVVSKFGGTGAANGVDSFEALKNINLLLTGGDRLGIVGLNGAGKSTLLKMMVGIYAPAEGRVRVNGRITPLIELGTGFDPELSGRENIYLNGSMLGRPFRQIQGYENEIIEFSELEEFIDQPIKYYSSGMRGRLAFAIGTTLDPEILLIDEIFSTGDARFRSKGRERTENLLNNSHIFVLVTHSLEQIKEFCNRAIFLHKGEIMGDGEPAEIVDLYLDTIGQSDQKDPAVSDANLLKKKSAEHMEEVGNLNEVIRVIKEENVSLRARNKALKVKNSNIRAKDNEKGRVLESKRIFEIMMENLVEIKQPLVLISQVERSGGVLLSDLLDGHPQLHSHPYKLHIGHPKKTDWPVLDLNSTSEDWFEILREPPASGVFLKGRKPRKSASQDEEEARFLLVPSLQKRIFEACIAQRSPQNSRDILDCYMTSYFNSWMDNRNNYSGDKVWITTDVPEMHMHEDSLEAYFADYSDGKLIAVVRDPRHWFVSLQKHNPDYSEDLDSALTLWSDSSRAALKAKQKYGDRVCIISFDDLLSKTRETMSKLSDFLGIRFEESMLQPTLNRLPICADSYFFDRQFELCQEPLTRHLTLLSPEVANSIEEQLMALHSEVLTVSL